MNIRVLYLSAMLLMLCAVAIPTHQASAWFCGGADNGNPDDCWSDGDCTGMGVCANRQCQCGWSIESRPICGDRCADRGYVCYTGNCYTQHVTDCRGISNGDRGGVISYCQVDNCAPGTGSGCQSAPNACGARNNGTIQCNGSCSASTPPNPAGLGNACTSAPNACGQTNSGTIQCNGSCSAATPANPAGYGNICQSAANICGMKNNGTIQCNGSCNAAVPANALCPGPACSASPNNAKVGDAVTAIGSSGVTPYLWSTNGDGSPGGTTGGNPKIYTYGILGPKTITISDSNVPPKFSACPINICAANYGAACTSTPNACGQTAAGTYNCGGICTAITPGLGGCPPPQCSVNPPWASVNQSVTATGSNGAPPYSWNTGGGNPNAGAGGSIAIAYGAPGPYTVTISDTAGHSGTCNVSVGNASSSTGQVQTSQNNPKPILYSTLYTIRLTVWDSGDKPSTPVTVTHTTGPGPWAAPAFTMAPPQPAAGQPVTFTDQTNYGPGTANGLEWNFGDGTTGTTAPALHTYAGELKNVSVTLKARSTIMPPGIYCSATSATPFNVLKPIPGYREVRPGTQPSPEQQPGSDQRK